MTAKERKQQKADYETFKNGITEKLVELGVAGIWDINFVYAPELQHQAEVEASFDCSMVTVRFSHLEKNCSMKRLIAHETAHVLTAEICGLAGKRYTTEDAVDRAAERLAVILEKVL